MTDMREKLAAEVIGYALVNAIILTVFCLVGFFDWDKALSVFIWATMARGFGYRSGWKDATKR